jgi:hypothetical protein
MALSSSAAYRPAEGERRARPLILDPRFKSNQGPPARRMRVSCTEKEYRNDAGITVTKDGGVMKSEAKRKWVSPEVHTYGTFGAATQQDCEAKDKTMGATDGFTFEGAGLICSGS